MKTKYWLIFLTTLFLLIVLLLPACSNPSPTPKMPASTTQTTPAAPGSKPTSSGDSTLPPSAPAKQIVLNWAHSNPPGTSSAIAWEWYASELEKRSKGRIKINLYPNNSLFKTGDEYKSLVAGVADFATISSKTEGSRWPLLVAHRLPSVSFPNTVKGEEDVCNACVTMEKEFPSESQKQFSEIKVLAYMIMTGYIIQGTKEVHKPSDLKGMKIASDPALATIFEDQGGAGVSIIAPDVYMSLKTKVIDATVAGFSQVLGDKLYEIIKYSDDYVLSRGGLIGAMNLKTWNSLPSDIQELLVQLGPEAMRVQCEKAGQDEVSGRQAVTKAGGVVSTPTAEEIKLWQAATSKLDSNWIETAKKAGYTNADKYLAKFKQLATESWK
jgi:TRAP-type C4-dicarboxylate transport system substrate-binding protein